jgi:hypothetical protein
MFTGGLLLVELFEFGTLLRIGMAVDPLVGGILGTSGSAPWRSSSVISAGSPRR